ncbi:glycosyltransferase, putative [Pediculus humanus corporis]|uniref:EGF domain-specific O-linked N-acetylglucosamine transferase n=1 Tax=Pediculus humanus subsp. corporis TaxID=121224 RepID=E0VER0_PEDHC|nr:glycosyltransferase, putative [Pediculus humanus corporis]EEB11866.1 glycosyltransferase, putative [Pediculus humanus corporis]
MIFCVSSSLHLRAYIIQFAINQLPFTQKFPEELKKCLSDEKCKSQEISVNPLPCWGYEENCHRNLVYSQPVCTENDGIHQHFKKNKTSIFYNQGDFGYIKSQRESIRVICEPKFKEDTALECSDHLQFCRGRNLFMNFSSLSTIKEPFRYKMDVFSYGDIGGYCELHKKRLSSLVDHLSPLQSWAPEIRFFKQFDERPIVNNLCDIIIMKPTFIMKIDATVNMYHHFCDFFNLYASLHVNMSHPLTFSTDINIIIWETFPYHSNFDEMWRVFSNNPILTLRNFIGKTVCFKNVVFPLLPRMIFGLYYNTPLISGCKKSGLFKAFSEFVLHRLKIKEHERENSQIKITLLSRETSFRNILNEKDLINSLSQNKSYNVKKTVFNKNMRFSSQLEIIRNTDILIGMHGAGLTHLLFLPDWAGVFELYNCEDENCYMDLARLRGVEYITWEDKNKLFKEDEGHHPQGGAHAKFTNYAFDVDEFLRLVDKLVSRVIHHEKFLKKITLVQRHEEL